MENQIKESNLSAEKNTQEKKSVKPTPKSPAQKKREREDFKRKYFDYYDDFKTNIKQDW